MEKWRIHKFLLENWSYNQAVNKIRIRTLILHRKVDLDKNFKYKSGVVSYTKGSCSLNLYDSKKQFFCDIFGHPNVLLLNFVTVSEFKTCMQTPLPTLLPYQTIFFATFLNHIMATCTLNNSQICFIKNKLFMVSATFDMLPQSCTNSLKQMFPNNLSLHLPQQKQANFTYFFRIKKKKKLCMKLIFSQTNKWFLLRKK